VQAPKTNPILGLLGEDQHTIVWWGTEVEAISALARRAREGGLDGAGYRQARSMLVLLATSWSEVRPSLRAHSVAERLLQAHSLRAADALQLARVEETECFLDGATVGRGEVPPGIRVEERQTPIARSAHYVEPSIRHSVPLLGAERARPCCV